MSKINIRRSALSCQLDFLKKGNSCVKAFLRICSHIYLYVLPVSNDPSRVVVMQQTHLLWMKAFHQYYGPDA